MTSLLSRSAWWGRTLAARRRTYWYDEVTVPAEPEYGPGMAPLALNTPQVAAWHSMVCRDLFERRAELDARSMVSAFLLLPFITRYVAARQLLPDGRQFCLTSSRQLAGAIGWDKNRVNRTLKFLTPYFRLIRSGGGKTVSMYEMVGIEPVAHAASIAWDYATPGVAVVSTGATALLSGVTAGTTGVTALPSGTASAPSGVVVQMSETVPTPPERDASGDVGTAGVTPVRDVSGVVGDGSVAGPLSFQPSYKPSLSPQKQRETDLYQEFLDAFPRAPGKKAEETRRAFDAKVKAGYAAEDIVAGAKAYWDAAPDDPRLGGREQWRYPLKFLQGGNHFPAFCRRRGCNQPDEWSLESARIQKCIDGKEDLAVVYGPGNKQKWYPLPSNPQFNSLSEIRSYLRDNFADEINEAFGLAAT